MLIGAAIHGDDIMLQKLFLAAFGYTFRVSLSHMYHTRTLKKKCIHVEFEITLSSKLPLFLTENVVITFRFQATKPVRLGDLFSCSRFLLETDCRTCDAVIHRNY